MAPGADDGPLAEIDHFGPVIRIHQPYLDFLDKRMPAFRLDQTFDLDGFRDKD